MFSSTGPDDYEGLNRIPLTFPPGAVSRSVTLRTVEDNDVEDRETLTATLTVDNDVYPGVSLRPDSASIDIIDDDSMYTTHLYQCLLLPELEQLSMYVTE